MIINEEELEVDVVFMIAEDMEIPRSEAKEYCTRDLMIQIMDKMFDAESDYIHEQTQKWSNEE